MKQLSTFFKILGALILSVSSLNINAQIPIMGNEWINYNQNYYKFKIGEDGVYRIPQSLLQSKGIVAPGSQLALYREGVQVPIYVSTNNTLSPTDYIEFYGKKADGKMDTELYANINEQGNEDMSIISDSASYFLTYGAGNHERLTLHLNLLPQGVSTPAAELFCVSKVSATGDNRMGFSHGFSYYTSTAFSYTYHSGKHEKGEGPAYFANGTVNLFFNLPGIYTPNSNPYLLTSALLFGKSVGLTMSHLVNNNVIDDRSIAVFNLIKDEVPFNTAYLAATTQVSVKLSNNSTNRVNVLRSAIKYNRNFDFSNTNSLRFNVQGNNQIQRLALINLNTTASNTVVDETTKAIYHLSGNEVLLDATSDDRSLYFTDNIKQINELETITFRNYNIAINQGDYIILSDDEFINVPNGGIEQYKAYRSSITGGSYNVLVVSANELYDQFGYGVDYHPLGIRRFLKYVNANSNWTTKPQHMFIVGKGLSYNHINHYLQNRATLQFPVVPTFGNPGADMLFAENNLNKSIPILATGRLSAFNNNDVESYLIKVKKYEQALLIPNVPNLENSLWKKRALHVAGSQGLNEQIMFLNSLSTVENIIKDSLLGSIVYTPSKSVTSVLDNVSANVDSVIEHGAQLVTFYGHASASGFDFNLNSPEKIHSSPKFPIFLAYGCDVARIFEPTVNKTISENYLAEPDGGSIAMLACTNIGWTSTLTNYMLALAKKMSIQLYGNTIGQQLLQTVTQLLNQNESALTAMYTAIHSQNLLLQGDPGLKVYSPTKPDYYVDSSLITILPSTIDVTKDFFKVSVDLYNLGKAVNGQTNVKLTKTKPGSSTILYSQIINLKLDGKSNVFFNIPIDKGHDSGTYNINIEINEAHNPDELSFANNQITVPVFIAESNLKPNMPYDFSIVNQQGVFLTASTANSFVENQDYIIEIDTSEYFNSPMLSDTITSEGGVIKWQVPFTMVDSTVYYWRTANANIQLNNSNLWEKSSFIYLANGSEGWNQSHYFQYKYDSFSTLQILDSTRVFEGMPYTRNLRVQSLDYLHGGANDIFLNGIRIGFGACVGNNATILFSVFDPKTGKPLANLKNKFPGSFGSCDPVQKINQIEFSLLNSAGRKIAMDFIDSIKDDYFVMMKSNHSVTDLSLQFFVNEWLSDTLIHGSGNSLYHKLLSLGLDFSPFTFRTNYVGFAQKGNPDVAILQFANNREQLISFDINIPFISLNGSLTSTLIGPATSWTTLKWRSDTSNSDGGTDVSKVSVYGIENPNLDPNGQLLFTTSNTDTSLANISVSQYPYLKLRWYSEDTTKVTLPHLKYWRVLHSPIPEMALSPNLGLEFVDSLQDTDNLSLKVAIQNLSNINMDSVLVRYKILDANNNSTVIAEKKYKPLLANDTIMVGFDNIPMISYPGNNVLFIEINPDNDQSEQSHINNIGYLRFFIDDGTLPVDLLSFTATRQNQMSFLQWITVSEHNNRGFFIERSSDNKNWIQLGFVNSLAKNGNSSTKLDYNFSDKAPNQGVNFYRLKQVDFDGKYEYSNVRMVRFDGSGISIHPNPTNNYIEISGLQGGETIIVFDVTGKKVKEVKAQKTTTIDMKSLNDGIYHVNIISTEGSIMTKKVVKLK